MDKGKNKTFIIPYVDQGINFWQKLSGLYGGQIMEVYFPIIDDLVGTGRPKQPDKHLREFLESKILPVSVLINPLILPPPKNEVIERILNKLEFYITHYNVTGVTVTNLDLARTIKSKFPGLKLTASTLMEIYNEQHLVMLGEVFDNIVPSNRVLRDIRTLKILKKRFKGNIRIIVNEACLSSCINRTQHFYEMSNPEIAYPDSLCNKILKEKPWLRLTGGWILPQHLYLIEGLYDEIKLAGRISLQKPERYFKVCESYMYEKPLFPHEIGGGPASVHIPVDISAEFYKYTLYCKKNCTTCSVCSDYWKENTAKYE